MTPYEMAIRKWESQPRDGTLEEYEGIYKRKGYLFVSPEFYVMCRPVRKYAPLNHILNDEYVFGPATSDSWYVMLMAGDMAAAIEMMPFELPWMCWVRDTEPSGRLRFCETARLLRALETSS